MKKFLSILMSLVIIVSLSLPAQSVLASDGAGVISADRINSGAQMLSSSIPSSVQKTHNSKVYYGDGKELYNQIRKAFDARAEKCSVRYFGKGPYYFSASVSNEINRMIKNSMRDELSVSSTDGDYAQWNYSNVGYEYRYESDKSGYYFDITLSIDYYNSASEEKQVDSAVNSIVTRIRKMNMSDYDTLKYIHDYICDRTTYSYKAYYDSGRYETAYTAYGALVDDECVCQGYANAFYRICKELGYKVRIVNSDPYRGCHGWNMVMLDGRYYFVDLTWDDEIRDDEDINEMFKGNSYYYFLVDYETLMSMDDDMDELRAHYIDDDMMEDDHFVTNYFNKLSNVPYDSTESNSLSTCNIAMEYSSCAYNGERNQPSVTITDPNGEKLVAGVDYKVSYSANTNCGRAFVTITGINDHAGESTVRTFTIVPPRMTKPSLVSGGRAYNSITLSWTKPAGNPTGYQVQVYKNGAWSVAKGITNASTTSCKVTGLAPNTKYYFRVKAYSAFSRINNYGAVSDSYCTYTVPKTPSIKLSTKSKSITASWSKLSCTGYQIQYSLYSNMKNARTVSASSSATSKRISSLKKGKRYYVRARSYRTITSNGKKTTYYSTWSAKKSITVK